MPSDKLQFRMKYNGVEYEFTIDPIATEGSGHPISSDALYTFMQQLVQLCNRNVATPSQPHQRVWSSSEHKWLYYQNNDNSLITAEAVLDLIDYIRANWIDKIVTKIGGIDGYQVTGD